MNDLDRKVFMILHKNGDTIATWGQWNPSKKQDQVEQLEEYVEEKGMKAEYDNILKRIARGKPSITDRVKAFIEVFSAGCN